MQTFLHKSVLHNFIKKNTNRL